MVKVAVVSPARPPQASSPPELVNRRYYQLAPVSELPCISATRTVRSIFLGERWGRWHASLMRRHARFFSVCYMVGLVYRLYGMLVPSWMSGRWWLAIAFFLQFPGVTSITLNLRYEFVQHLAKTFDFWFFSVVNIVWVVSLAIAYNDTRATIVVMSWLELENTKLSDAHSQRSGYYVGVTSFGCATLTIFTCGVIVGYIEIENPELWYTPQGQTLHIVDILANVVGTVALLMGRLAFRHHAAARNTDPTMIKCSTCRCRLKFVAVSEPTTSSIHPIWRSDPDRLQLEWIPIDEALDVSMVIVPSMYRWVQVRGFHVIWTLVKIVAVVLGSVALASPTSGVWMIAAGFNVAATAPLLALHHRQLLRRLLSSFDFVFLLLQLILVLGGGYHLAHWALDQCVTGFIPVLWLYVVSTYDALTPDSKQALRWTPRKAASIAVMLLFLNTAYGVQLVFGGGHWLVQDRVLVRWTVAGHKVEAYTVPLILSRLLFLIIWSARIAWRLIAASRNHDGSSELITLQGTVQYRRMNKRTNG